jgi:hypothetical protein
MSSSDEEIRKEVWRGQVPICFSLSENELSTLNGPPPLYLQIPRASYLPLYSATLKVRQLFLSYLESCSDTLDHP